MKVYGKHHLAAGYRMSSYLIFGLIYPLIFVTEAIRPILSLRRPYDDCQSSGHSSVFALAKNQTLVIVSYALEARAILQRSSR